MNTTARLAAYGAAVLLVGAGTFAAGTALAEPVTALRPAAASPDGHGGSHGAETAPSTDTATATATALPAGLASSEAGYTVVPITTTLPSTRPTEIAYRILGPDGAPVTGFDIAHEKQMHLIVVRSDTADFQHLHPTMAPDGTWRAPVTLAGGGTYRAFADFKPAGGESTTLGVDLFAPGEFAPVAPKPSRTATVADGYQVTLAGDLTPGQSGDVTLTVSRDGRPVTDLQPYLGAYGHLVALRTGDLGYLHVHPQGEPGDGATAPGPQITFAAAVPSAGTYRLFLDFQHEGRVHTAQFTVPTTGAGAAAPTTPQTAAPAGDTHSEGGH